MHQLTSLDTQILRLEDGRNHGHVSVLVVCAGHLDAATLRTLVAERIHLLPPLRRRLAEVPFGLDYPYWVDADGLDLDYHVRELSLPAPGDDAELTEQAARIVSVPLDRARPLWELYVIGGLAGGRTGILLKLHHAAVDGMAAANLLSVLFDAEPPPGTYAGEPMPG